MGSETEGGVLEIHFGNKTDVDICSIGLVENNTCEIWLSEAEAWLPSDCLKFYTDGSLFEGRVKR
jgi:hypothetical protein